MAVISNCDAIGDYWSGTALTIDTTDKKEGTGSLKDTVASPVETNNYNTSYNPPGTWDWSAKKHILFWLKCDRVNTAFTFARLYFYESARWRYWNLTFEEDTWTATKKLLSTGNEESGTPPNLALIDQIQLRFRAADTTEFYKKIDKVRVSSVQRGGLTMFMDMNI